MFHSFYRKTLLIGPGGWRCHCCAPAPGPARKAAKRNARKRWHRVIDRIVRDEQKQD